MRRNMRRTGVVVHPRRRRHLTRVDPMAAAETLPMALIIPGAEQQLNLQKTLRMVGEPSKIPSHWQAPACHAGGSGSEYYLWSFVRPSFFASGGQRWGRRTRK